MAPPKFKLPNWLLLVTAALAAVVVGSAVSFAQATSDERAIMSTIDQAVRTG